MNKLLVRVRTVLINEYFILSIILVLGFILRLYKIDNPIADWHSWRQADTSSVSRNFVKNGINMFYPEFDDISSIQTGIDNPTGIRMVEFPVYNAIHAIQNHSGLFKYCGLPLNKMKTIIKLMEKLSL